MEFYSKYINRSFELDPNDKDRYIVLACAKNEEDYIIEWVEHYLNLGFDKVIIADNNDEGNNSLTEVLNSYIESGVVQILDCRGIAAAQVGLYADFCELSNFKWCAFYDCDEFLEIGSYSSIKDYLDQFEGYDVVLLNWLVFGPNGQIRKEDGGVQERFRAPQSPVLYFKDNGFYKSIVRGNREKFEGCLFNGSHTPRPAEGKDVKFTIGGYFTPLFPYEYSFQPKYKNGYIKHYYTKSFDEWVKVKSQKGWPDGTENLPLSKYLIFNDNLLPPADFMKQSIFRNDDTLLQEFADGLNAFDVVLVKAGNGEFTYQPFGMMMGIFSKYTDHTFIFSDDVIDDAFFSIMMEYGYATGNRILFCKNQNEIWNAYLKYHKRGDTYYIIIC